MPRTLEEDEHKKARESFMMFERIYSSATMLKYLFKTDIGQNQHEFSC